MGEIVRLQKYIAMCGVTSRRKAEEMIVEGKVYVNGKKVTEMGTKIEIGDDNVLVEGKQIGLPKKMYYIMLNKPKGYITANVDQFGRPTVLDLVSIDIKERVFPVGRLDYDTEGVLLLTNDGEFAHKVMHPRNEINKTYIATIKGGIKIEQINKLRRGIKIDDYITKPAQLEIVDSIPGKTMIKVIIHEGKNRQVRKMFASVGLDVAELQRTSVGNAELGNLSLGRWRHLTSHEVSFFRNL